MSETHIASLKEITACHQLNIAVIGNPVSQLDVHGVARRTDDAASPKPVRGTPGPAIIERRRFIAALRRKIELAWHPERLATADKTR
jgi:diadenosine tetraphosphate (Ap4A) HIT family hydrolase